MKSIQIIQNWAAEPAGTITEYLDKRGLSYKVVLSYAGDTMPDVAACEAAIVLGCPHSVNIYNDFDFLKKLYAFMAAGLRHDLPILGICLGGQMLAKVLGAQISKNDVREIGLYKTRLTEAGKADRIFDGFEDEFEVFHWHNDTFGIPYGATLLAEGEECRNQAFRKCNAVGLQFHLEPRPEDIPLWCDEYSDELAAEQKTKEVLVKAFAEKTNLLRESNFRLIKNFLS